MHAKLACNRQLSGLRGAGGTRRVEADASAPGQRGPGVLRRPRRDAERLEGYSPVIGVDENRPQGLRTRLGLQQIRDRAAGTDALPGAGFGRQWLQDVLYGNRHYSAEIMLDGVLTLCATQPLTVVVAGTPVDVGPACNVLARWDRRNRLDSVGTHVWTELWRRLSGQPSLGGTLYAVPFDPAEPVTTPRGLNIGHATVVARTMADLGATVKYFADNAIPLDRPWGQVQFETRNGQRIPIHGGLGGSGVYNAIQPAALVAGVGYPAITHGSSYIQAVTFTPSGPQARAIVTYSQSSDPANPNYADMTRLFSSYGWIDLPFAEGDIRRDPNLQSMRLFEHR